MKLSGFMATAVYSNTPLPNQEMAAAQPNFIQPVQQPTVSYVNPSFDANVPIALYPTGAMAIVPAPPTYELIPHRVFVGGFPAGTTESELRTHFEQFAPVRDVKLIKSPDGSSKGYGFVTFESEDEAENVLKINPQKLEFRNRKLNMGPALRRMASNHFPTGYPITAPQGQFIAAAPPTTPYTSYTYVKSPSLLSPPMATPPMQYQFVHPLQVQQVDMATQQQDHMTPTASPIQKFAPAQPFEQRSYANVVGGAIGEQGSQQPGHQSVSRDLIDAAQNQPHYQQNQPLQNVSAPPTAPINPNGYYNPTSNIYPPQAPPYWNMSMMNPAMYGAQMPPSAPQGCFYPPQKQQCDIQHTNDFGDGHYAPVNPHPQIGYQNVQMNPGYYGGNAMRPQQGYNHGQYPPSVYMTPNNGSGNTTYHDNGYSSSEFGVAYAGSDVQVNPVYPKWSDGSNDVSRGYTERRHNSSGDDRKMENGKRHSSNTHGPRRNSQVQKNGEKRSWYNSGNEQYQQSPNFGKSSYRVRKESNTTTESPSSTSGENCPSRNIVDGNNGKNKSAKNHDVTRMTKQFSAMNIKTSSGGQK